MIDTVLIKENYSRMTDEQLINLAQTEGHDLTGDSLEILHSEFVNRRLDTTIFGQVINSKTERQTKNIQHAQAVASEEFTKSLWIFAFDRKEEGSTNEEIQKGLIEKGLDEQHSSLIVKTLESKTKEMLGSCDSEMLTGGIICAVGLIITYWTFTTASNGGSYIVAWGAIIFGAIRFFRALTKKTKYNKILDNIQLENTEVSTT